MVYRRVYRKRKSATVKRRKPTMRKTYVKKRPMYSRIKNSIENPPRNYMSKMRTVNKMSIASGAVANMYIFPITSGSDPMGSNGTVQPKNWDRICGLYGYYQVSGGSISLTFTNEMTNPMSISCWIDGKSDNQINDYTEAHNSVGVTNILLTEAGGSRTTGTIRKVWSSKRMTGTSTATAYYPTTTTGAAEVGQQIYLHIYLESCKSAGAANLAGMMYYSLNQTILFRDPKSLDTDTTAV